MTAPVDGVEWRYTFVDLLTKARLARLPLVDADLAENIGAPAAGTGRVPISDSDVRNRDPWAATTPRRTACFAQRIPYVGGREQLPPAPAWAGIVWGRKRSGLSLALSMSTVESYWARRVVAASRTFADADDATILGRLFTDAEAVPYGGLGLTYDATLYGTSTDRTVLAADRKTVLETVQSVAANAGVEWRIVPTGDGQATPFGWRLIRARRLGRTGLRQLRWISAADGRPGNELLGYEVDEDGSAVPNETTALGAGQGKDQLRATVRTADELAAGFPLTQSTVSGTNDLVTQAAVNRHAASSHADARLDVLRLTSMTVRGDRGPTLDTYGLGDTVTATLRDLLWQVPVDVSARIAARRILPGQPGRNETVAMTLTPTTET